MPWSVSHSPNTVKETYSCTIRELIQCLTPGLSAGSENLSLTHFLMGCLHWTFSLGTQEDKKKRRQKYYKNQRGWMTSRKQCLPNTTGHMHMRNHRDYDIIQRACAGQSEVGSHGWEEKVISDNDLQLTSTYKGKKLLSLMEVTYYINHTNRLHVLQ